MSKAILPSLLLAALLTGAIAAEPAGAQTPRPAGLIAGLDRDRLHFDVDAEGTVWVRGRTYKASFSQREATYVPFLGSKAPRNFPVALRVESVTVGGAPIAFDADARAVRAGDTIEYDRGSFRERYLLAPDSVEQTFVFEELRARGEIALTVAVDTELAPTEAAEGFQFANELGHVQYGRAFAFDAAGPRVPIASRLTPGRIEIVAPAALVESAVGAFVIDPVLSTFTIEGTDADAIAADTAWDVSAATWLTVCEEAFSAGDHDIHVVRHSTAGTVTGGAYVDASLVDWRSPAIANNDKESQFLVVAQAGVVPDREIWGRRVEATVSLAMSSQFVLSEPVLGGDKHSPDVGGDRSLVGSPNYCVVWEIELTPEVRHDIHARLVPTSGPIGGLETLFLIDGVAGEIKRNPAISNSNGRPSAPLRWWNIVYEFDASSGNRNIHGRRLDHTGDMWVTPFTIGSATSDERNPSVTAESDVSGGTNPWMVAWEIDSGTDGWDVRCRTLNGGTTLSTMSLSQQLPNADLNQVSPSCDTADGQFVVAWDQRAQGNYTSTDIRIAALYSIGGVLGLNEGDFSASPFAHIDRRPKVVTQASSGSTNDDALVVFDREVSGPGDIIGTGYDLPNGGPVSGFCAGDGSGTACPCGNTGAIGHGCASSVNALGAVLGHSGDAQVSDDSFQLRADGLPNSATVLFFQGTAQQSAGAGAVFGDGLRCVSGTVLRLATRTASAGFVVYPSSISDPAISTVGAIPAIGALRYYQVWYRNSAAFCTASTFNLTNGLRAQWIP